MNFYDAIRDAAAATIHDPWTIHGRRTSVFDLIADSGARFDRMGHGSGTVTAFHGIDVIYNDAMPPNVVEFHSRDGRVLRRLIQASGQWYEVDPDPVEMLPTSL